MNVVISVATYGKDGKMAGFLDSLADCVYVPQIDVITVVLNTGGDFGIDVIGNQERYCYLNIERYHVNGQPRQYASVMLEKIRVTAPYCNDDTILFNFDPDYHFNPCALEFAGMIFKENEEVNYLCLLKEPGLADKRLPRITLSGFTFVKYPSAMGGAIITRWKHFYPLVQEFFNAYGVTGNDAGRAGGFDQAYWKFLTTRTKNDRNVFMLDDFSLMQHGNLISSYMGSKGPTGVRAHMYGLDYDPRINPFEWREALNAKS